MSKNKFTAAARADNNKTPGLGSLIRPKKDVEEVVWMDTSKIYSNPQVRTHFDPEEIEALAKTLKGGKQKQAITVFPADEDGRHCIYIGERRWRACKFNNEPVRAFVDRSLAKGLTTHERIIGQLVENVARNDLTALELATAFDDLRKEGMKVVDIAESIGKKSPFVSKHLKLLEMPESVVELYNKNIVTYVETLNILSELYKVSPESAEQLIAQAEEQGGLGRPEAQRWLDAAKGKIKPTEPLSGNGPTLPENQSQITVESGNSNSNCQSTEPQESATTANPQVNSAEQTDGSHNEDSSPPTEPQELVTTTNPQTNGAEQTVIATDGSHNEVNSPPTEPQESITSLQVSNQSVPSLQTKVLVMIDNEEYELLTSKPSEDGDDGEAMVWVRGSDGFDIEVPSSDCTLIRVELID
ncbi:ParB/RepB/Spo0J family partition protein [Yersinia enterocolitica]|uniref:ParB/RepB/Spo0J family partition protein n=1 Tax=Yersinia enterocolitica TaxID=630 RepID=UPI001C8E1D5D|nr:ParB/RepB/Spo0J family partition protein [Yersinia enterocolitica]EKN4180498.1 ParB/RepB/Spo0J family partition protein [Yersinia enterocolitica]MBX9487380.1 ParB/RepB/Spo0J family partition protein [Yersinia enterocolitica]MBX9490708.1 ParB/RepB/Spo0J family partition protein [Yersinia enterocolitica]HEN3447325.1 ParB/RepB/Spo0J family partition protein [Yersinia enterocolitica]